MVDFLKTQVPNKEWSGYILYREHGNLIINPDSYWIEVIEIFPMSIGTSGGVSQESDVKIAKHLMTYVKNKEVPPKYGIIHSHHNMGIFFSNIDYIDLEKGALISPYLSIVVDNDGGYLGRIGIVRSKTITGKSITTIKDSDGKIHNVEINDSDSVVETKELIEYHCKIELPESEILPKWFLDQWSYVKSPKPKYYNSNINNDIYLNNQLDLNLNTSIPKEGYDFNLIENFLSTWIIGDKNWIGTLAECLKLMQRSFKGVSISDTNHFKEELFNTFDDFYLHIFGNMNDSALILITLDDCIKLLKQYHTFSKSATIITEVLNKLSKNEYVV